MLVEIKRINGICSLFIGSILQIMCYYKPYNMDNKRFCSQPQYNYFILK